MAVVDGQDVESGLRGGRSNRLEILADLPLALCCRIEPGDKLLLIRLGGFNLSVLAVVDGQDVESGLRGGRSDRLEALADLPLALCCRIKSGDELLLVVLHRLRLSGLVLMDAQDVEGDLCGGGGDRVEIVPDLLLTLRGRIEPGDELLLVGGNHLVLVGLGVMDGQHVRCDLACRRGQGVQAASQLLLLL